MELGQQLKEARLKAGFKQEELAARLGVSRQTVSSWENNRSYPDIASVLKLSNLYGLTLDEMLKGDQKVLEHFETKAAKQKKFWRLALEYSLVIEIIGILLAGQNFLQSGVFFQGIGAVCTWISLWMHLKLFDHTRQEIRLFVSGFSIILLRNLVTVLFPEFPSGNSLLELLFLLFTAAGPFLVLFSNVWSQFWKSPRFLLILGLLIGVPFFNLLTTLNTSGSLNESSPFSQDYRIEEVLYPEEDTADPAVRIALNRFADSHSLRIYKNGDDYKTLGTFTYQQPAQNQREKGIWTLVPEEDPAAVYRLAVEDGGQITLSYSRQEQLQWKWLLREEYLCRITVATFGHTMYMNPDWLLSEEPDPEPYFRHTDVTGTADLTITVSGLEGEQLVLIEEYHHGDSIEYNQYQLDPVTPGIFQIPLETRHDGNQEYALYRIPHKGGEFRFTLVYDVGARDAFAAMMK